MRRVVLVKDDAVLATWIESPLSENSLLMILQVVQPMTILYIPKMVFVYRAMFHASLFASLRSATFVRNTYL